MHKTRKRCYIYTRVSTELQVDGYSLEAQRNRLLREAAHREMTVVETFSDEGKSGKNTTGRPAFQEMIRRIENSNEDQVDYVLVFKLSRFARNTADVLFNLQLMQDFGVNLLAVEEGIDSAGPTGKLMISVIAAVAEIERENIKEQTMAGRRQKARSGKWNGGQAPYGYQLENGMLVIDEAEAKIVREIFDRYVNTSSGLGGVAKYLNDTGYRREPRGNGKYQLFTSHFIKLVLDNPVYCGKIAYGRRATEKIDGTRNEYHVVKQDSYEVYDGRHEAIVDEATWNEAQLKRAQTGTGNEKIYSLEHEHILSGILRCPVCGAGMYGTVNRKKKKDGTHYKDGFYYVCKHRRAVDGQPCTYRRQPPQEPINAEVIEILQAAYRSPTFAESLKELLNQSTDVGALQAKLEEQRRSRAQYIARKDRLAYDIDNLDPMEANYNMMYEDMTRRLRSLYDEISGTDELIDETQRLLKEQSSARATMEAAYAELQQFATILPKITDAEKKAVAQEVLACVEIYPERQPNGRYVRAVQFQFPILMDGETPTNWWYTEEHDETVCLLSKLQSEQKVEIDLDLSELDLTSAESAATYQEIKDYVQENFNFQVTSLQIAQTKRSLGLPVGLNYNPSKKDTHHIPQCPPEKTSAIRTALEHFQML